MNTTMKETEADFRLRKAKESLINCRETEGQARAALARAVESTKRAKEQYEAAFMESEKQAGARRAAGLESYRTD